MTSSRPVRKGTRLKVTDGPEDLRFTRPHRGYSNKPSNCSRPFVPLHSHCLYVGIDCAMSIQLRKCIKVSGSGEYSPDDPTQTVIPCISPKSYIPQTKIPSPQVEMVSGIGDTSSFLSTCCEGEEPRKMSEANSAESFL